MTNDPRSGVKLTYDDYLLIPDDGLRHEIIDGEHYVTPAPDLYHQKVSRRIQFQLYTQIELRDLGEVLNAPADVQLSEVDVLQPDLLIVLAERSEIMVPSRVRGAPDLVVEILSPSTAKRDRALKRARYEAFGVREYWIVDPRARCVEQLVLEQGHYRPVARCTDEIHPCILDGVRVDLTEVW